MITDDDATLGINRTRPAFDAGAVDLRAAAELINIGEKIAICGGADCDGASQEVFALAELLKAPVAHTLDAKHVLEPNNPHDIGISGVHEQEVACSAMGSCDTLVVIGVDSAAVQTSATPARILRLDAVEVSNGLGPPAAVAMVGDIQGTLRALMPLLVPRASSEFRDACVSAYLRWSKSWRVASRRLCDRGQISGGYLASLVDSHASVDVLFSSDSLAPAAWISALLTMNGKRRVFISPSGSASVSSMTLALGLQKCQPGRQVICMCSDRGISALFADLFVTIQEELPIKIAVLDAGHPSLLGAGRPDFGKIAQSMGLWARTVRKAMELEDAVRVWLVQPGPALLNVRVHFDDFASQPLPATQGDSGAGRDAEMPSRLS